MRRSQTSRSHSAPGRSRPVRRRVPTASRSTTSGSVSRKSSESVQRTSAGPPSRGPAANLELVVPERRTKIVATLGPASDSPGRLRALIAAGMDAARLNLSHGTHADHAERARRVREVEAEVGRPIALIADLQGPKLRVGDLKEPIILTRGEEVAMCAEEHATT